MDAERTASLLVLLLDPGGRATDTGVAPSWTDRTATMAPLTEPAAISLSRIDAERFGVPIAKATVAEPRSVEEHLRFCDEEGVALLIARCSTDDIESVHEMEEAGFLLMDCLVWYHRSLEDLPNAETPSGVTIRLATHEDADDVEAAASTSFSSHRGHYHADPRLAQEACTQVYASWARATVESEDDSDIGLVAICDEQVVGFATLRLHGEVAQGLLAAVLPEHRSRGIYRALIIRRLQEAHRAGASSTIVSAHIANVPPQACWTSLGYAMTSSSFTFHRWFDEPSASSWAGEQRDR